MRIIIKTRHMVVIPLLLIAAYYYFLGWYIFLTNFNATLPEMLESPFRTLFHDPFKIVIRQSVQGIFLPAYWFALNITGLIVGFSYLLLTKGDKELIRFGKP